MDSDTTINKLFTVSQIPDLTGKVALVTGANSPNGIGFHTAFQMAVKGAIVYIGARSTAKYNDAIREINHRDSSIASDRLRPFIADLGDLRAVKNSAERLMAATDRLDILVNNAGLLARPLDFDSHGISVGFSINHLAPFLLTNTLLPLLKETARAGCDVRVITLSSTTHDLPPKGVRFNSLDSFNVELGGTDGIPNNQARYGLSKLANILFAKQLQAIFDKDNINALSISLHPGGVVTDGSIKLVGKDYLASLDGVLSPADGAITSLFAATSQEVLENKTIYGGSYLMPFGKITSPSTDAQSPQLAEELWNTSERVVDVVLHS